MTQSYSLQPIISYADALNNSEDAQNAQKDLLNNNQLLTSSDGNQVQLSPVQVSMPDNDIQQDVNTQPKVYTPDYSAPQDYQDDNANYLSGIKNAFQTAQNNTPINTLGEAIRESDYAKYKPQEHFTVIHTVLSTLLGGLAGAGLGAAYGTVQPIHWLVHY